MLVGWRAVFGDCSAADEDVYSAVEVGFHIDGYYFSGCEVEDVGREAVDFGWRADFCV